MEKRKPRQLVLEEIRKGAQLYRSAQFSDLRLVTISFRPLVNRAAVRLTYRFSRQYVGQLPFTLGCAERQLLDSTYASNRLKGEAAARLPANSNVGTAGPEDPLNTVESSENRPKQHRAREFR